MTIADILILCIVAPFALFCLFLALLIGYIIICLVIGVIIGLRDRWRDYWADKLAELDEGDKWKK